MQPESNNRDFMSSIFGVILVVYTAIVVTLSGHLFRSHLTIVDLQAQTSRLQFDLYSAKIQVDTLGRDYAATIGVCNEQLHTATMNLQIANERAEMMGASLEKAPLLLNSIFSSLGGNASSASSFTSCFSLDSTHRRRGPECVKHGLATMVLAPLEKAIKKNRPMVVEAQTWTDFPASYTDARVRAETDEIIITVEHDLRCNSNDRSIGSVVSGVDREAENRACFYLSSMRTLESRGYFQRTHRLKLFQFYWASMENAKLFSRLIQELSPVDQSNCKKTPDTTRGVLQTLPSMDLLHLLKSTLMDKLAPFIDFLSAIHSEMKKINMTNIRRWIGESTAELKVHLQRVGEVTRLIYDNVCNVTLAGIRFGANVTTETFRFMGNAFAEGTMPIVDAMTGAAERSYSLIVIFTNIAEQALFVLKLALFAFSLYSIKSIVAPLLQIFRKAQTL